MIEFLRDASKIDDPFPLIRPDRSFDKLKNYVNTQGLRLLWASVFVYQLRRGELLNDDRRFVGVALGRAPNVSGAGTSISSYGQNNQVIAENDPPRSQNINRGTILTLE